MKTFAQITSLVTTTDGENPAGYIEVETTILAPMLRDLLRRARADVALLEESRRCLAQALMDAEERAYIAQLMVRPWIKCSERMPTKEDLYIVYRGKVDAVWFASYSLLGPSPIWCLQADERDSVTHWQAKPDGPIQADGEGNAVPQRGPE